MPLAELAALTTVCAAGKTGVKKTRELCRERRGIRCLDSFEQTFKDRLENYLREYLLDTSELDDDLTDDILNRIEINSDQIFEPLAHADGQRGVTGETRDKLIDSVFDELETVILDTEGIPDPAPAEIQQTLRPAIETAYRNAMTEYLNSIDDDADRATLTVLTDIREGMEQLKNSHTLSYRPELFGEQLYNRVVISDTDTNTDTQHAITQAKESLGVSDDDDVADQQLRFLDRDIHSELTDLAQQYQLIIGRKGSGKTRTLAESIDPLLKTGEITEVVTLSSQGGIPDETALAPLAETQSHPQGGMLILWDDIHKTDTDVVTSALGTLTDALNSEGRSLYLRATVRQRRLADFLPESLSRESLERSVDRGSKHELLQRFSPVDVPLLDEQSIEELLTRASEAFELEMSADVREDLAEKVREADPTPFYIRSFCEMQTARPGQRQRQGSTRVTAADVREFPQTAVDSWKNAYEDLEGTKPQQDLLKILVILSEFGASSSSSFGVGLVKIMYREGFVETTPSAQEPPARGVDKLCERLAQAGWVRVARARRGSEVIGERKLSIHDVQLEAVAAQFGFEETHESVSECLRRLTPDPAGAGTGNRNRNRGIHRLAGKHAPTLAQMMANYASTVQRKQLSMMFSDPIDEARELFDGAVALLESGSGSGSGSGSETPVSVHIRYAEFLKTHGDHGEVTEQYERALTGTPAQGTDTSPSLSGVYSEYAEYMRTHDPDAAEEIYEEGIDATGDWRLYEEYAEWLKGRDPEKAAKIYEEGIDATGYPRLYRRYADFLEDRNPEKAAKIYEDGIDAGHNLYEEYVRFLEDRNPEKAEKIKEEGIDATGFLILMLYRRYADFLEDRNPEKAAKIYEEGIDATGDVFLYSSYADFLEDRNPEKAEKIYEEGIDATGDWMLYEEYADFLRSEDRPSDAEKIYQDGIDATGDPSLYEGYVRFLADEDRNPEKAEKIYQDGIDATGDWRLYEGYARFLADEDRNPEKAEKIYQDGIDATGSRGLYSAYARFLADEDRNPEKAEKIYEDGIDATGDSDLYEEYADFLADEDRDPEKAEKIYEEGIDATGFRWLYLRYADFLRSEDRPSDAEKIYQDGIDATGDSDLYKEYADFLRREDRPSDAEKIYQDGIDATGATVLYEEYADFLRSEDRPSDAEKIYQDGIDATGDSDLYEEYADFLRSEDRPSDAEKIYQDGIDAGHNLYEEYADFLADEDRDPEKAAQILRDGIAATGDPFGDLTDKYEALVKEYDCEFDSVP